MTQQSNGAYPELTVEVGQPPYRSTAVSAGDLGQTVDNALREILAWRPRVGDPHGFVAALNQAFSVAEVEGHTEWSWTPRSFTIQADMGAVTGAQASIYARARAALDQSIPLVEGLYPLRADADEEDVEAIRSLVRTELTELVEELGMVGGPRLQRVEGLFHTLLGHGFQGDDPAGVQGMLGVMSERFGLEPRRVNTIDEEQNLTNFLIVVDHIISLQRSWANQQHYFDRVGRDVFLGTQLVQLSRSLAVVAESVQEACFVLDSVFIGEAERQTVELKLGQNQQRLTIAELLGWVERFAVEEGPQLIRDAGKDGVVTTVRPTLNQLRRLVRQLWTISKEPSETLPHGITSQRAQRAFQELTVHLDQAFARTDQIRRLPRPTIEAIDPAEGTQEEQVRIVIDGKDFVDGARVRLTSAGTKNARIDASKVKWVGPTELKATFDLAEAEAGLWNLVVINPDGGRDTLQQAFSVEAEAAMPLKRTILSVEPTPLTVGAQNVELLIRGLGFDEAAEVSFGSGITVHACSVVSPEKLRAQVSVARMALAGPRNVTVTSPGYPDCVLHNGLTIAMAPATPPMLKGLSPAMGAAGVKNMRVTVGGNNFHSDASISFGDDDDIEVTSFKRVSGQWVATINIDPSAPPGARSVRIENGDGQSVEIAAAFTVASHVAKTQEDTKTKQEVTRTLELRRIEPEIIVVGEPQQLVIEGAGFWGTPTVDFGSEAIHVSHVQRDSETTLLVEVAADHDLGGAPLVITVVNPDGTSASLETGLKVLTAEQRG